MNLNDFPQYPEASKLIPGTLGSLAAMLWIRDSWPRKIAMFIMGAVLARYATDDISKLTGLNGGFAGFILGLFGMAIVAKVFDTVAAVRAGTLASAVEGFFTRKTLSPPSSKPKDEVPPMEK